ncbi:hypothetical protein ABPG74_013840 [Tetrahymena malaccensis]
MNNQNDYDKFQSQQHVQDLCSLEKKIKRLQIEKKRNDKRDCDIKKTFKSTRNRFQKNQNKIMQDNQMIQEKEQNDYSLQQIQNYCTEQQNQFLFDLQKTEFDDQILYECNQTQYQILLHQIDQQIKCCNIENVCPLLEQVNGQLLSFTTEFKKENNIKTENKILINGFSLYKNEPYNSDINMHLPKLIEYGYIGLLQETIKQFINLENKHFVTYQNNQLRINEKLTIKLLDTVKYLFQLLKIYKNKFMEINSNNQNQKNAMLDENEEGNLNNKYWLHSVFQIFRQFTLFKPQIQQISNSIQSIQEKIQEIEELQISFSEEDII